MLKEFKMKYQISDNEIFYLKNIKHDYFLSTYIFDKKQQKYKYSLEQFVIKNNNIYPLSEINNRDIVLTLKYIDGLLLQISDNLLIPIKEKDMTKNDLIIPDKYETYETSYEVDAWRK